MGSSRWAYMGLGANGHEGLPPSAAQSQKPLGKLPVSGMWATWCTLARFRTHPTEGPGRFSYSAAAVARSPGSVQRFVVVLQVGRQLPVPLQQESVQNSVQLHVVQSASSVAALIRDGNGSPGSSGPKRRRDRRRPLPRGAAVAHQGCLEKGFSGHGVAVMALLVHGIFHQWIVVEQGVRPLSADIIELGQIFGCGPVA